MASPKRATGFPDIPTTAEGGVPEYQVSTWHGLWAPKNTPRETIARMTEELKKAYATPELQAAWVRLGAEPPSRGSPVITRTRREPAFACLGATRTLS